MGARGDALAKKFEAKADEAAKVIEGISDAEWKKVTTSEKWSVGVVAHHIAVAHGIVGGLIKNVADGKADGPGIPMDAIHEMNAKHAKDFAGCTKSDTLATHRNGAATTAALVRGLDDAQLARSANVIAGMPAMSAEQLAGGLLCGHVDEHLGSIRATVGR
jgi:hypothetical protein